MSTEQEDAETLIRELGTLTGRTRSAGRSVATGRPLIGWGIAWMVGCGALDLLTGFARIAVVALAWLAGMAGSWWPARRSIRTGAESRVRWGWLIVLVASPFLVTAAQPPSWVSVTLLLAALWSLAMCLFAVATRDVPYAIASLAGVLMAGVAAVQEQFPPLLLFGLTAGGALLGLGVLRTITGRARV